MWVDVVDVSSATVAADAEEGAAHAADERARAITGQRAASERRAEGDMAPMWADDIVLIVLIAPFAAAAAAPVVLNARLTYGQSLSADLIAVSIDQSPAEHLETPL